MPGPALTRFLLHHDPTAAEEATGIRAFLGEAWVHQVSVTFHAVGALLVAGGLAAILLSRSFTPGGDAPVWTTRSRGRIRLAVLGGWGFNFLGGIMRLYEPDHPGLTSIGEVGWVQVLVLKHLALLAAVGLSLLAVELGPGERPFRVRQHAAIALVLVLFASVSGGVATGLPLPGGPGATGDDAMDGMDEGPPAEAIFIWRNATLDLSGSTPVVPKRSTMNVEVPAFTNEIWAELRWDDATSSIWAEALAPDGTIRATSGNVTDTSAELTVNEDIGEGGWTLAVESDRAISETVRVTVRLTQGGDVLRVLEETVTVAGLGFEVNLWMRPGAYFNYTWSLSDQDPAIDWDIHSHPDGEVVIHHEGTDRSAEGSFTAGPDRIYSIFWRPGTGETSTLTYRLEGNFTVHSIFRGT